MMSRKFKFTSEKLKWGKARPQMVLQGEILHYNAGQEIAYAKDIRALIREMTKDVEEQILKLYRTRAALHFFNRTVLDDKETKNLSITVTARQLINRLVKKYSELFTERGNNIATKMTQRIDYISVNSLKNSLQKMSGGIMFNPSKSGVAISEITKAAVSENVALIKSIPAKYLADVSSQVLNSITTGAGVKDLIPQLQQYSGITLRRANLIALDQTRKVYNSMNKQRLIEANVGQFQWIHSGGGQHPRKSHREMNGKVYSFDNLPIINKDNKNQVPIRGIPGQAPNCRCTMKPVFKFEGKTSEQIEEVSQ